MWTRNSRGHRGSERTQLSRLESIFQHLGCRALKSLSITVFVRENAHIRRETPAREFVFVRQFREVEHDRRVAHFARAIREVDFGQRVAMLIEDIAIVLVDCERRTRFVLTLIDWRPPWTVTETLVVLAIYINDVMATLTVGLPSVPVALC